MSRFLIAVVVCAIIAVGVWSLRTKRVIPPEVKSPSQSEDRVATARLLRETKLKKLCSDRNLSYPPQELFLRAVKQERILEVWAGKDRKSLQLLTTYPLTAYSGRLGPKRREGDLQIPEGVYHIDRFNPKSLYHLSMGLNYPNASDRQFADPEKPGKDIFIHGRAASVGCLAIGDEAIEELYVLAADVSDTKPGKIPVHIFPARMNVTSWTPEGTDESESKPDLVPFWENLRPIYMQFEQTRSIPEVTVDEQGRYRLVNGAN